MKEHLTARPARRFQWIAVALLALGLGGCQHLHKGGYHGSQAGDPTQPKVTVVDGKIVIDQVVLYFPPGQGPVTITWALPPDSKLVFDEKLGITFEPRAEGEIVNCKRVEKNPQQFTCTNRHSRKDAYRYDINLLDGSKRLNRDPFVVNDF